MSEPTLPPLPSPIALIPSFVAKIQTTLVLKERMLSATGDDFHVKDAVSGNNVVCVHGKAMSLSQRKEVSDEAGNLLFTIRKEHFSIPRSYYCEDPQGNKIMSLDGKFSLIGTKADVSFINNFTGQPVTLHMNGNFRNSKADIVLEPRDGRPPIIVATIHRDHWNVRDILGGKQTYYLTVAPGMDLTAMVAACVCLDERAHDSSGGGGGGGGGGA